MKACLDCWNAPDRLQSIIDTHGAGQAEAPGESGEVVSAPATSSYPQQDEAEEQACLAGECEGTTDGIITLPEGYTMKKLVKEYKRSARSHSDIAASDQQRWEMYAKAALLVHTGHIKSCLKAEELGADLKLNRLKLGKVLTMLRKHGELPAEVPEDFRVGQNGAMALTLQGKRDLLAFIRFHSRCSMSLSVPQVTRCLVALRMSKDGLFEDFPDKEDAVERVRTNYDSYYNPSLWHSFQKWVRTTQEKEDWVNVKALRQKQLAEVTAFTPAILVQSIKVDRSQLVTR